MQSNLFAEQKLDIRGYDLAAAAEQERMRRDEGSVEENVGLEAELGK